MKIFISWSGDRSKDLALALREWLPLVLHYVEPWLSEADIDAGERWAQSVASELEASNFGIICVTSENVGSPWILFEAGALTKSLDSSRVIPLLLDLEFSDISGPLSQFQAKKLAQQGISEILSSIQGATETSIPEARAKQLFEALWPELEKKIEAIPDSAPDERNQRPQHEILEDLVSSVRGLDSRIRDAEISTDGRRFRSRKRMHPMVYEEMAHRLVRAPDDPFAIVLFASAVKDDAPWLSELAMETYRSISSGKPDSHMQVSRLREAFEFAMRSHGPDLFEDISPRMIDTFLSRWMHGYSDPRPSESSDDSKD